MTTTSQDIQTLLDAKEFSKVSESLLALMQESKTTTAWQEAALGTSQYHLGELGGAVTHLQNAVLIERFNSEYRSNLIMAQAKVDSGLGERMSHPADWGFELATWLRPKESASLAFLLLNLFLILRFLKKPNLRRDLALGGFVVIFLGLSAAGYYGQSVGVVSQNSLLKRQPVESSAEIRSLPAGSRVRKIRSSGDYTEVERSEPGSLRGWVKTNELHLFH